MKTYNYNFKYYEHFNSIADIFGNGCVEKEINTTIILDFDEDNISKIKISNEDEVLFFENLKNTIKTKRLVVLKNDSEDIGIIIHINNKLEDIKKIVLLRGGKQTSFLMSIK